MKTRREKRALAVPVEYEIIICPLRNIALRPVLNVRQGLRVQPSAGSARFRVLDVRSTLRSGHLRPAPS